MTEEKDVWEGFNPDAPPKEKPKPEELEKIVETHKDKWMKKTSSVPGWMWILQGIAVLYIIVNIGFLYASISNPAAGYIAAYMIPLTMLLFFFIYAVGELKKAARGEKNEF